VLVGSEYWRGLIEWIRERMLGEGKISPHDLELLQVCDDPKDIAAAVFRGAELQGF
jgi:predicted Rossmann-fold nucleotide-binding protein